MQGPTNPDKLRVSSLHIRQNRGGLKLAASQDFGSAAFTRIGRIRSDHRIFVHGEVQTDGPFVQDGQEPTTPSTVKTTIRELAELWGRFSDDVQASTLDNLNGLLATDT